MDPKLLLIPLALVAVGAIVMIFLNKKGARSEGVAQEVMKTYVMDQLPSLQTTYFDVVNLLEDAVNAQHIWVVAYNQEGLFFIPSLSNPLTQTLKRYEDSAPAFNLKQQLAATLFAGNTSENIDYIPFSAITNVSVQQDQKKIQIAIGETIKDFKYQSKDCFGADQEDVLNEFFRYLNAV